MNKLARQCQSTAVSFFLFFAFVAVSTGLLVPSVAQAEIRIDVDDRVEVQFEKLKRAGKEHIHRGLVRVTNVSPAAILAPLRLVITDLKDPKHQLHNADGFTADGDPYIEIALDGDQLAVGTTSVATEIQFSKLKSEKSGKSKKSKKSGKSKKSKKSVKSEKIAWQGHPLSVKFLYAVTAGGELATTPPTSLPVALQPGMGPMDVLFRVNLQSSGVSLTPVVFLRNLTLGVPDVEMFDDGNGADIAAGDGIYIVTQSVNTNTLMGGDCLTYVSTTTSDQGFEIVSESYDLCATDFPVVVARSNTDSDNQVDVGDGTAVGDEVLITADDVSEEELQALAKAVGAEVVGTLLPLGLYQLKFPQTLSEAELNQILEELENTGGIEASLNLIGAFNSDLVDDNFSAQHGLKLISSDDLGATIPKRVWDVSGADGSGITVTIIDSGVQDGHPDLDSTRITAEISSGDNTDVLGHGTQMAGIIGAITNNATPVGSVGAVAPQVRIESIKITDSAPTKLDMIAGLNIAAGPLSSGDVVLAAFSIKGILTADGMCTSINTIISNGGVVVGSAGNDDDNSTTGIFPAKCNDPFFQDFLAAAGDVIATANLPHYIVVGASACNSGTCTSDSREMNSNHGAAVDISAPGVNVPTTTIGSGFTTTTGTSPAAAFTAGAAAVLRGCGVAANEVFNTLDLGATTAVTELPNRINLYNSLASLNTDPSAVNLSGARTIDENVDTSGGSLIGDLSTIDSTSCDTHIYSVGGADAANFSISDNELRLDDGILDFETKSSYAVTVSSTDFYGQATNQDFVIDVNDLTEGSAFTIDFDTRQNGTPFSGSGNSITANEYDGVTIQGNDPSPGLTSVDPVDSVANPSTDISGYHVRVGAFSSTPATQLDLNFTTVVTSLSFDFGSPTGGISVEAFDASSISLGVFPFVGTGIIVNQAGFDIQTGSAALSGIGNIATVEIRPNLANEGLFFDNLNFTTP
jgi:hypothetical protein